MTSIQDTPFPTMPRGGLSGRNLRKNTGYDPLLIARLCARLGWRVLPVNLKGAAVLKGWPEQATTDLAVIDSWFGDGGRYVNSLVGIVTGSESGIWATDLDVKNGPNGIEAFEQMVQEHGQPLPETLVIETPSGGRHLLWAYPDDIEIVTAKDVGAKGIDTRGWHGYIVAPFTVRLVDTQSRMYAPLEGSGLGEAVWAMIDGETAPERLRLPRAPRWLEEMAIKRDKTEWAETGEYASEPLGSVEELIEQAADTRPGEQEDFLFRFLSKLRGQNRSPEEMADLGCQVVARFTNVPGHPKGDWTPQDVEAKVQHVCESYEPGGSEIAPELLEWALRVHNQILALPETSEEQSADGGSLPFEECANADAATPIDGASSRDRFPSLDWDEAFAQDFTQIDYLPGRFMERGQQVALVGGGKVGKSVFVQEWTFRCVAGLPFLGSEASEPLKVLYFDRENNLRDIVLRMKGFGATPQMLRRLDYRLFPGFTGQLDQSATAALELLTIVADVKPDIVVLDTVSRFISGNENDADTWLSLYRAVHVPLKKHGVACVRVDHMGKDEERGSRGSSAKTQDVDHVWELTKTSESRDDRSEPGVEQLTTGLRMKRTHSRTGLGEDFLQLVRRGAKDSAGMWLSGRTRHDLLAVGGDASFTVSTDQALTEVELIRLMDQEGVPIDHGFDRVRSVLAELGVRAKTDKVKDAIRKRKERGPVVVESSNEWARSLA